MSVNFYDSVDDNLLKFAVIVAKNNGKWVFCKHKSVLHMNVRAVTENTVKILLKPQGENWLKKPERLILI